MDEPHFGPFNPQTFLERPISSASILALEEFRLYTAEGQEAGLDIIHDDNRHNIGEMCWEGSVLFEDSNRREISRNGLRELRRFSEERNMPINWADGVRVVFRTEYWRHAVVLSSTRPQWPLSATVFIDMRSDGDENIVSAEIGYRRLRVTDPSPRFAELSTKSNSQAVLYHIMTHISRVKGRHVSFGQKDVSWYASWFRQLYTNDPRVSFVEMLQEQMESHTFVQVLVTHKRLISKGNLSAFMRSYRRVVSPSPEPAREPEGDLLKMEEDEVMDDLFVDELMQHNHPVAESSIDIPLEEEDEGDHHHRSEYHSPSPSTTQDASVISGNRQAESRVGSSSSHLQTPYDPDDLRRLIPPEMMKRDHILPSSCIWHCPVPNCYTVLDLKAKLPRWALQELDRDQIKFLKHGGFTARSGDAQYIFRIMLNAHYVDHLHRLGLTIAGDTLVRIEPSSRLDEEH